MDAWNRDAAAELAPRYAAGYRPEQLRARWAAPRRKQRSLSACDLPEGSYSYERLVELACAADFMPPRGMAVCAPPLVDDGYASSVTEREIESGYAEWAMARAPSCLGDPRGAVIEIGGRPRHRTAPRP